MTRTLSGLARIAVAGLLLASCVPAPVAPQPTTVTLDTTEPTPQPEATAVPSTPPPPTSTATPEPPPTETPVPEPSATPTAVSTATPVVVPIMIPEAAKPRVQPEPLPATHTVCAEGCDFALIQEALDAGPEDEHLVIDLLDGVHTEAGVTITGWATIRGLGAAQTIVQAHEAAGEATQRVFTVKKGATAIMEGLTIRHGNPQPGDEQGGGIYNFGTLTLDRCVVRDNRANGGGGITNSGTLAVQHSTIADNRAHGEVEDLGDECGNGGGIKCGSGRLTIFSSTISGNLAGTTGRNRGGGVFIGCGCAARIVNSTISGNEARHTKGRTFPGGMGRGAGILSRGVLQIFHSTIVDNRSSSDGAGLITQGTLHAAFNIIADNRGRGEQCIVGPEGSLDIARFNLVEGGGCGVEKDSALAADPLLGPLQDNGGFTWTHSPGEGSPVIDAVPEGQCYAGVDQRGVERAVALVGDVPLCDLGAVEVRSE